MHINRQIPYGSQYPTGVLITDFKLFVDQYIESRNSPIYTDLFRKRYLVAEKETLKEIAHRHGRTRERMRQIIGVCINDIKNLLDGKQSRNHLICEKGFQERFKAALNGGYFSEIFINEQLGVTWRPDLIHYRNLFLSIKSIEFYTKAALSIYATEDCGVNLIKNYTILREMLLDCVVGMDIQGLAHAIGIPLHEIAIIALLAEDIENCGPGLLRIKSAHLKSKADRSYRVLHNAGKPLHYMEINKQIAYNEDKSTHLINDQRMVAVGRTGLWALKEWAHNTKTLREISLDYLKEQERPCTFSEIWRSIKDSREDITEKRLKANVLIYVSRGVFTLIDPDTIALPEWNYDPHKKRRNSGKKRSPMREMAIKEIVKLLKKHRGKMPMVEIVRVMETKGYTKPILYKYLNTDDLFSIKSINHRKIVILNKE